MNCEQTNRFFSFFLLASWCLRQVIELFSPKDALHLVRTHITSYLMVFASTGAPELNKKAEDHLQGQEVNQQTWDVILKDVMAKDFEDHVPKAC